MKGMERGMCWSKPSFLPYSSPKKIPKQAGRQRDRQENQGISKTSIKEIFILVTCDCDLTTMQFQAQATSKKDAKKKAVHKRV